jgi:hypothetical protein
MPIEFDWRYCTACGHPAYGHIGPKRVCSVKECKCEAFKHPQEGG